VQVQLASGRKFKGWVDPQTTADELWLRFETGRMTVRRPIAWESVLEATCRGQRYLGAQAREALLREVHPAAPAARPFQSETPREPSQRHERASEPAVSASPTARVASVQVEATLSNWDRDADPDGLFLYVLPLDATGELVPVRGSVSCELLGDAGWFTTRTAQLVPTERWVRRLQPENFGYRGAGIRLPFDRIDPERQQHWGDYARLTVRLSVPGQGTFETVLDAVRIRRFAPLRDRLRQHEIVHH